MWTALIDLLFPPRCAGCDAPGDYFCDTCRRQLVPIPGPVCRRCGDPLQGAEEPGSGRVMPAPVCPTCRRHPPGYDLARSVLAYDGAIRHAVHVLKYRGKRVVAGALGALLADRAAPEAIAGVDALAPVPLHPRRQAARGFNQAELLARPLASRLGVPCLPRALRRVHQESPQAELNADARRRNVLGAFVPEPVPLPHTVLLIDDVFSTGATADACARALKHGGASRVLVLTLTRALLPAGRARCEGESRPQGHTGARVG